MPSEVKALDRVFAPLHRMMEALNMVEPSINLCIIAYDKNDPGPRAEGLLVTNMKKPAELEKLLKDSLEGFHRNILFRTPRS